MTDKEKYDALVAEIERQYEETSIGLNEHENGIERGRMEVINALQQKIDTMKEEPASKDLEEEFEHVWDKELSGKIDTEAALNIARHFAEWQKKQDQKWLTDNHKTIFNNGYDEGFQDGRDDMDDEMIKQAVEGEVVKSKKGNFFAAIPVSRQDFEWGDKVKGIILKKD